MGLGYSTARRAVAQPDTSDYRLNSTSKVVLPTVKLGPPFPALTDRAANCGCRCCRRVHEEVPIKPRLSAQASG